MSFAFHLDLYTISSNFFCLTFDVLFYHPCLFLVHILDLLNFCLHLKKSFVHICIHFFYSSLYICISLFQFIIDVLIQNLVPTKSIVNSIYSINNIFIQKFLLSIKNCFDLLEIFVNVFVFRLNNFYSSMFNCFLFFFIYQFCKLLILLHQLEGELLYVFIQIIFLVLNS